MAVVAVSRAAAQDLDRIRQFLEQSVEVDATATLRRVFDALELLRDHPEIGRPLRDGQRELIILQGRTGFVALYQYESSAGRVLIARIRHQREVGYPGASERPP
jgi:plasmid stabilization system protein ParE